MSRPPWPLAFLLGVFCGAVGTIGLAYLLAAAGIDKLNQK